ncbi:anti-sigma factor family protein [Candidatus Neomarinimicrobiota bacterium]
MDRYQLEGYISDYIENSLSIAKRKEFEKFLVEHPESKEQVEAVRSTISQLKNLSAVKTSDEFMVKLQQRIAKQRDVIPLQMEKRKPMIFGFTPLTASMMSLVVLAIIFVGYELMPVGSSTPIAIPPQITTNSVMPTSVNPTPVTTTNIEPAIAEAQEDSSVIEEDMQNISPQLEGKINYVGTQ